MRNLRLRDDRRWAEAKPKQESSLLARHPSVVLSSCMDMCSLFILERHLASAFKSRAMPLLCVTNYIYQQWKNFATLLVAADILKHCFWGRWKNDNASFSTFQIFPEKGNGPHQVFIRYYFLRHPGMIWKPVKEVPAFTLFGLQNKSVSQAQPYRWVMGTHFLWPYEKHREFWGGVGGWCGEFSDSVFDFKYTKYLETVSQIVKPSNSVGDVSGSSKSNQLTSSK